ncbi:TolC family protein [soil metagenome]
MSFPFFAVDSASDGARFSAMHFSIQRLSFTAIFVIGVITLSTTMSIRAFANDAPLTLAQAQRQAVARSRQLSAQNFAVAASRDMAAAAGQLADPVLKLGIDNLPVSGQDKLSLTRDFMTMRRIGVMQEITRADKRQLRAELYDRTAEKSQAEKHAITATIERDTAIAWLDLHYANAVALVIAEQKNQAQLEIDAADGAYHANRGSQADVFAARTTYAQIEDRASENTRRIRSAKTMLARWIGEAAELPLAAVPAINTLGPHFVNSEQQISRHPQIAVLKQQQEIAVTQAKLALANKKSDWTVELAYQQRGPTYSNMLSIGLSIPFQFDQKNRQDRELSSRLAMVEQANAESDEMLREHVAQTRTMLIEWQNDQERVIRFEQELIPLAKQRIQATIAAYRGGKSSLSEVLGARRNEIEIQLQSLQLQAETARLWAQLKFLVPANNAEINQPEQHNAPTAKGSAQ